jgi:hypothetical protein
MRKQNGERKVQKARETAGSSSRIIDAAEPARNYTHVLNWIHVLSV